MKYSKSQIQLCDRHPTRLLKLEPQSVLTAPLVINPEGILVDGYRRYQLLPQEDVEVVQIGTPNVFEAALELNRRTRRWDEIDCFLWTRWARTFGLSDTDLPLKRFPDELYSAEDSLLSLLANGQLLFRQAVLILQSPQRYHSFFQRFLVEDIELNSNGTADLIAMVCDLARIQGKATLEDLFSESGFRRILQHPNLTRRQKGELLLKEMRILRYPYYRKKAEEFSTYWRELNLDNAVLAKKDLFLRRGLLEISFSCISFEGLRGKVTRLYESLGSPVWSKIWEE